MSFLPLLLLTGSCFQLHCVRRWWADSPSFLATAESFFSSTRANPMSSSSRSSRTWAASWIEGTQRGEVGEGRWYSSYKCSQGFTVHKSQQHTSSKALAFLLNFNILKAKALLCRLALSNLGVKLKPIIDSPHGCVRAVRTGFQKNKRPQLEPDTLWLRDAATGAVETRAAHTSPLCTCTYSKYLHSVCCEDKRLLTCIYGVNIDAVQFRCLWGTIKLWLCNVLTWTRFIRCQIP